MTVTNASPCAPPAPSRLFRRRAAAVLAAVWASAGAASAQPPAASPAPAPPWPVASDTAAVADAWAPDIAEPGSVEAIRSWTTAPEYLPQNVAYLPDDPVVPSPSDVLGHHAGAPGELSSVAEVHGYMRRLAAASDRVQVRTLGTSEEGREILLVLVSDAANLAGLERIVEIDHRLAEPRRAAWNGAAEKVPGTGENPMATGETVAAGDATSGGDGLVERPEMERLAADGKVVYYLLGGLHSTETGSPEMLMELAYRLAVSERPEIRRIRREVVVAITPVVEPDGRDRVVEWYERHLRGRNLPWEELREIASPPYWGHYVFHDNNRDGMQRTQALTRAVQDAFWELRPQVVHDLHESLPLLYISTGHGPYSTAVDPVTINEWTGFAHHEAATLEAQGLPGVWTWGFWDGWWPGYLVSVANNHNAVGRFYETFGNSHPGTFERDLSKVKFVGEPVTEAQWYRPWPPGETVRWSLRNNANYMQAGVLAALGYAARHREELLGNVWAKARRAVERGRSEAPYAWLLPQEQRDPARLAYLVNQLLAHGIEVQRLEEPPAPPPVQPAAPPAPRRGRSAAATPAVPAPPEPAPDPDAERWPPGSYVVRMDQPHRNAALTFLEVQDFPADEPNPPYDDVAWTWPLLFGVDAERVDDPAILQRPMRRLPGPVAPGGGVGGYDLDAGSGEDGGGVFLLADRGQNALLAAAVALAGWQVDAAEEPFDDGGVDYPAGSWIVRAPRGAVEEVAARLGLTFQSALVQPRVRAHLVDLPRLGVVHTWTSTQDVGWARYTLDREGVPYELVSPDDLRRGALRQRFDVLFVPDAQGDFASLVHGIDPRFGPLAYTATAEYPSHGTPDASPDVTGGMGLEGLLELSRFVADGGLLLAVGNAGTLAVDGGMVRHVSQLPASTLRSPGSEVAARVTAPRHPLAYGYEERTSVYRRNGPLYDVPDRLRDRVVVQFGDEVKEIAAAAAAEHEGGATGSLVPEEIEVEEIDAETVPVGEEAAEAMAQEEMDAAADVDAAAASDDEAAAEGDEELVPRALVLSGWVSKLDALAGKPAILDLPSGRGRVILYAFNPLHRYLNHSDFRFLYNALLNWNDLP